MSARINRVLHVINLALSTNLAATFYLKGYWVPFVLFVGIGGLELYRLIKGVE